MKKLFLSLAILTFGCCLFSSCQDDDVVSEKSVVRDYQTDAQILSGVSPTFCTKVTLR